MTRDEIAHPAIVSRDQWLAEQKKLLADEKQLIKHYDRVNAEPRRLPMVKGKDYFFDGPNGKPSLKDLFELRRQLIVYHLRFDPTWDKAAQAWRANQLIQELLPRKRLDFHGGQAYRLG
jgi:predicted dithiol-disulfide oxidoreductase (DUF899 family)